MKEIRILVVEPDKAPRVESRLDSNETRKTWYKLISPTTHTFEVLHLTESIDLLCDEEGRLRGLPLNMRFQAPAPQIAVPFDFMIDMTKGQGMAPNTPGLGYHEILGTFILARIRGSQYVTLTDTDIAGLAARIGRGPATRASKLQQELDANLARTEAALAAKFPKR